MRFLSSLIVGLGICSTVHAMPLHPERGHGGPHIGAAWSNPASTMTNPAALPHQGPQMLIEGQHFRDWRSVHTHRYAGIDPNTQSPYALATSKESIWGGFVGLV